MKTYYVMISLDLNFKSGLSECAKDEERKGIYKYLEQKKWEKVLNVTTTWVWKKHHEILDEFARDNMQDDIETILNDIQNDYNISSIDYAIQFGGFPHRT